MQCHDICAVVASVAVGGLLLVGGCIPEQSDMPPATLSVGGSSTPQVTVPNGSSPAKANAPHAPINDSEQSRTGWNYGNGDLWVTLPPQGKLQLSEMYRDKNGSYRQKFGWWRGHPGTFWVTGRRLDVPAAPLRYSAEPESYGAFGPLPSYLYLAGQGYWEITGHLGDKTLTFVVQVVP